MYVGCVTLTFATSFCHSYKIIDCPATNTGKITETILRLVVTLQHLHFVYFLRLIAKYKWIPDVDWPTF